nr:hypothetical protein GCM10020185_16280 [Pseudomonas brassicacearum subsp. brassicacearum]
MNTEEAARRIAKAAGVPLRTVSYAGLKDRQALTRQWFSVQLPGKADPDLSAAENDTLKNPQDRTPQAQAATRRALGQWLYLAPDPIQGRYGGDRCAPATDCPPGHPQLFWRPAFRP